MSSQYLAVAFMLFMTGATLASVWKSLTTGTSQPASLFLKLQGKPPILRAERPFAYWNHTLPWLLLTPLTVILTVWTIEAATTWPQCNDTVKEQCWYASN